MALCAGGDAVQARSPRDLSDLLDVTAGMRSRWLDSVRDTFRDSAVADPDMWLWVRQLVSSMIGTLWKDMEHEIERSLEKVSMAQALSQQESGCRDARGPGAGRHGVNGAFGYYRLRALVLSHFLPYNRSIFGKLADPLYVLMYLVTLVPFHGVRVLFFSLILLMLIVPWRPDEFQLINFILLFKGMQVVTGGLVNLVSGCTKYFACFSWHPDTLADCLHETGPGTGIFWHMLCDYIGNILLVWIAFFALPYAKNHAEREGIGRSPARVRTAAQSADEDQEADTSIGGLTVRGGRMRSLMQYDAVVFALSLVALAVLTSSTCGASPPGGLLNDPQFKANVYWCLVMYSMLSLPFLVFEVPLLNAVLTHSDPTGFNSHGACVAFFIPQGCGEQAGSLERTQSFSQWFAAANTAATVLRIVEAGRVGRGGDSQGDYRRGDFSRGLWLKLTGRGGVRARAAPSGPASAFQLPDVRLPEMRMPEPPSLDELAPSAAANLRGMLAEGRLARGGEAEQEYQFGDFSAGVWNSVFGSRPGGGACPRHSQPLLHFCASSVEIPACSVLPRAQHILYTVMVHPEGSMDAESAGQAWAIRRRFGDFRKLAAALGMRSIHFQDAPFPSGMPARVQGYVDKLDPALTESRRSQLEAWLNRVLQDASCPPWWAGLVNDFLNGPDPPDAPGDSPAEGGPHPVPHPAGGSALDHGVLSSVRTWFDGGRFAE